MTKKTKAILDLLDQRYGTEYRCYLNHENAWQLLIATILSAQCTDARVNTVTGDLFRKYPGVEAFASADLKELEKDIYSTGFYHNKAKNIIACCKDLMEKFGGEVPSTLEEMRTLAGVGQKTANVVYSVWFGGDAIAVDTHVFRVSNRLGISEGKTPAKVEEGLCEALPKEIWSKAHHYLIYHGRRVCHSQKPDCTSCTLKKFCKFYNK